MKVSIWIITVLLALPVAAYSGKNPHRVPDSQAIIFLAAAEADRPANVGPGAAASSVQKRYGGKILSVELGKNKVAYRVKVLTEAGVVKIVTVDAASGRIVQ